MAGLDAKAREVLLRLPLVTLGLATSSLLVLLGAKLFFTSRLAGTEEALRDAVQHFVRHPVLAIPPRLLPVLRDGMPGYEGSEAFQFLASRRFAPEQAELDALARSAFGILDTHPQRRLGLVPAAPTWTALWTHPLIHAGWLHWVASLAPLLLVGPVLERLWGRRLFAGVVAALAAGSAGLFALIHAGLDRPLLGASVLASGLAAAAAARLRRREVDLLAWLAPFAPGLTLRGEGFRLGAVGVAGALLGSLALQGSLPPSLSASPAPTAHALAAALGALLALGLERSGLEARLGQPLEGPPPRPAPPRRPDPGRARRARAKGDLEAAFALLREEARRSAGHRDAVIAFFEVACELGRAGEAAPALERLVAEELRRGAVDAAVSHWRRLAEHAPASRLAPALLVRLAPRIREQAGPEAARLALGQALASPALAGPIAAEIAQQGAGLDPALARAAAQRALEGGGLGEAESRAVTALAGARAEGERPFRAAQPAELPPNAFYEEQDRSAFGAIGDLGELDEPEAPRAAEAGDAGALFPGVRAREALPVALEDDALLVELPGRGSARLELSRLRGVALAGVRGLAPRAVVLVDLLLADPEPGPEPLALVRLRSDRFDPRRLVPQAGAPLDALLALAEEIAKRARCPLLPAPAPDAPGRVPTYDSLERYARVVLRAGPWGPGPG